MPTIRQRFNAAVDAFRSGPLQRKEPPFLWPGWREGKPTWQLVDFQSYAADGFERNALIYAAIMYKARQVTAARLRAYQGDRDAPDFAQDNHPLARLASRPNPHQSQVEFAQQTTVYLNVSGNLFIMLDRPRMGAVPTALYALRPDRVRIIPANGGIEGYIYVPEGKSVHAAFPILPQDMMHIKLPNPLDPYEGMGYGLSPLAPLARSGDVDNQITKFLKLLFEKGMMFAGTLNINDPIDDNTEARLKERWRQMYGGVDNWTEIAILDKGTTYNRITPTFEEMGFEIIDNRNESRILAPLGVPPILIGTKFGLDRSTFSNFAEARRVVWEDTLIPEHRLYTAEYDYFLTSKDGGFLAYDYSDVPALRQDVPALISAAREAWEMGVPADQAFAMVGLDNVSVPGGDRTYISTGVALSAAGLEEGDGDEPPEPPPAAGESEQEAESAEQVPALEGKNPAPPEVGDTPHPFRRQAGQTGRMVGKQVQGNGRRTIRN